MPNNRSVRVVKIHPGEIAGAVKIPDPWGTKASKWRVHVVLELADGRRLPWSHVHATRRAALARLAPLPVVPGNDMAVDFDEQGKPSALCESFWIGPRRDVPADV